MSCKCTRSSVAVALLDWFLIIVALWLGQPFLYSTGLVIEKFRILILEKIQHIHW